MERILTRTNDTIPTIADTPWQRYGGRVVLVLSVLLVTLSLAQLLYRATLPTDGWSIRGGAFGTDSATQLIYLDHLVDEPTALGTLDRVYAVNAARLDPMHLSVGPRAPELRAKWDAGIPLQYSVLRAGIFRLIEVPPVAWSLLAWLRYAFLNIERAANTIGAILLIVMGSIVFARRSQHPAARVLLLVCAAIFAQWISASLPDGISVALDPLARITVAFFTSSVYLIFVGPGLLLFALVFPKPKPIVERHRWILALPIPCALAIWALLVVPGQVVWNWLGTLPFLLLTLVVLGHSMWTAKNPVDRAQLRVAGWGALMGVTLSMIAFLPVFGFVTGAAGNFLRAFNSLGITVFGLALAVAVLRYRLLDIDLILRRSLVYSIVTALLVLIYFASIVALQSLFQGVVGQQSQLAIVISTLAIAALFNPVRHRVQEWIDERFYRSRYDAERIAAEFGRTAQDESDLEKLSDELLNVIRDSLEPTRASMWLIAQTRDERLPLPPGRTKLELPDTDPLFLYLAETDGVTSLSSLKFESDALETLREANFQIAVPLINQGELLGMVNIGPRRSDQEYSSDDKRLLTDLANRAAPSIRVAQLVQQRQVETAARERMASELRVARIIQETLLPKNLPDISGYKLSAYWQPAQAVGGDFYDFIQFEDGKLALIVGDVTDKGVPAALVMSTTRTVLRSAAERVKSPGAVLERANETLCPDIPPKMFVTVLYAVLDPATGVIRYANAGHDLPYMRRAAPVLRTGKEGGEVQVVEEMRATGMPLGLLPGMRYEEKEIQIQPGDTMLIYSDGLVEAHNPQREMFSFRRLRELVGEHAGGAEMVPWLIAQLKEFVGVGWEQEDDVTIVTLQRDAVAPVQVDSHQRLLADFTVSSAPGNEREAMQRVAAAIAQSGLTPQQIDRLTTAVAECTMNAMEHGNGFDPLLSVAVQVYATPGAIGVRITDRGGGKTIAPSVLPDLDAKLAGMQSPRGWGLFLIQNMVDEVTTTSDEVHHTVELLMRLPAGAAAPAPEISAQHDEIAAPSNGIARFPQNESAPPAQGSDAPKTHEVKP